MIGDARYNKKETKEMDRT